MYLQVLLLLADLLAHIQKPLGHPIEECTGQANDNSLLPAPSLVALTYLDLPLRADIAVVAESRDLLVLKDLSFLVPLVNVGGVVVGAIWRLYRVVVVGVGFWGLILILYDGILLAFIVKE